MTIDGRTYASAYIQAIQLDQSLPIEQRAATLWVADMQNRLRWIVRPILQFIFSILLYLTWFLKRLPLPQFSAHKLLQKTICWFCRHFVSPEANELILRHYATESNILNFLRRNSGAADVAPIALYPKSIDQMLEHSFVDHDQELFRIMLQINSHNSDSQARELETLDWTDWQPVPDSFDLGSSRATQVVDFESAHALFMCLFCFLLTADEYRDAINGFNLDQSIAIRIGKIIGDPSVVEYAFNKYPLYLVGPGNLGQRFLMHGFFTEHLYAHLELIRRDQQGSSESPTGNLDRV